MLASVEWNGKLREMQMQNTNHGVKQGTERYGERQIQTKDKHRGDTDKMISLWELLKIPTDKNQSVLNLSV
jgi:hypothetical protein